MSSKQFSILILSLLSIAAMISVFHLIINRQESPLTKSQIDMPDLRLDNKDTDIEKWILPAIMKGESLDKEYINEHVFISKFQMTTAESVNRISFLIFYYIDNRLILKNYQIRDHGLITITTETNGRGGYEKLISIGAFNEMIKTVNKDKIKELFGIEHKIAFVEIESISRLESVEIEKETIVVLNNQFVKLRDISQNSNYAVCFIYFAGTDGGSKLPFFIKIN